MITVISGWNYSNVIITVIIYCKDMPLKGWKSTSLKEDTIQRLKNLFEKESKKLEAYEINSISEFIDYSINKFSESPTPKPRMEHFNVFEDHVTVIDHDIGDRIINVYIKDGKLWCEHDESFDCIHVGFAYSIPKVQRSLA